MIDQRRIKAVFYRTAAGSEPVRDCLLGLPDADHRIVGYDISTAEFGWPIGMPTCKAMGQGFTKSGRT